MSTEEKGRGTFGGTMFPIDEVPFVETPAPTPAPAPEENLADVVTNLLMEKGHPNPTAWKANLHPDCYTGEFETQRNHLNNAWSHHLGLLAAREGVDTYTERYCLLDMGTRDQWIQNFISGVLPTALKHALPVSKKQPTTTTA